MKVFTPISDFERELARTVGQATFPPATASKRFIRAINEGRVYELSESGRIFLAFVAHRFRRQYTLTDEQWAWVKKYKR